MKEKNEDNLSEAISHLTRAIFELRDFFQNDKQTELLKAIHNLEESMAIKLADVKAAVAQAAKNNKEAFGELGTKIADLNTQIAELIAGAGDPDITDEAFLADLTSLGVDAKALADIVPNPA